MPRQQHQHAPLGRGQVDGVTGARHALGGEVDRHVAELHERVAAPPSDAAVRRTRGRSRASSSSIWNGVAAFVGAMAVYRRPTR